jgi:hypothetical protein
MVADRPDECVGQLLVLDRICYLGRVAPRRRIGRIQRGSGWDANRFFWISSAPCWRRYFAPLPPVCRDAPAPCTKGTSQFILCGPRVSPSYFICACRKAHKQQAALYPPAGRRKETWPKTSSRTFRWWISLYAHAWLRRDV